MDTKVIFGFADLLFMIQILLLLYFERRNVFCTHFMIGEGLHRRALCMALACNHVHKIDVATHVLLLEC